MRIVVLAGGIGGARFLLGVRAYAREVGRRGDRRGQRRRRPLPARTAGSAPTWTASCTRWAAAPTRNAGWGRVGESWTIKQELAAYGAEPAWFGLGDKDVATHLVRTTHDQRRLSAVAGHRRRWPPAGSRAYGCCRPPTTGWRRTWWSTWTASGGRIHFQEWWVRYRARRAHRPVRLRRRGDRQAGPRGDRGDRRGRRGAGRAEQPGGEHRAGAGRARRCATRSPTGPAPVVGRVADHRRRAGARDGRPVPGGARRRVQRRRGGPALRRPRRAAACSTVGWSARGRRGRRCRG